MTRSKQWTVVRAALAAFVLMLAWAYQVEKREAELRKWQTCGYVSPEGVVFEATYYCPHIEGSLYAK